MIQISCYSKSKATSPRVIEKKMKNIENQKIKLRKKLEKRLHTIIPRKSLIYIRNYKNWAH